MTFKFNEYRSEFLERSVKTPGHIRAYETYEHIYFLGWKGQSPIPNHCAPATDTRFSEDFLWLSTCLGVVRTPVVSIWKIGWVKKVTSPASKERLQWSASGMPLGGHGGIDESSGYQRKWRIDQDICVYIHIYMIYIYIHTYIHTYIHRSMHACMHAYIHYITFHYTTLHYITLNCITLRYTTLHYTTLHYT